jgi:thiol-disulfide isomerase/thioredoxin
MAALGLLAARCVLAATFLIAGLAKLANKPAAMQALRNFGVPRIAQPLMPLLPWAEIAVAFALPFAATAWYAAWGAVLMLLLFTVVIGLNLARGERPPCNCFGQLHSAPITPRTLLRNGILMACAVSLVVSGRPPATMDLAVFVAGLNTHWRRVTAVVAFALGLTLFLVLRGEGEPETDGWAFDEARVDPPRHKYAAGAAVAEPPPRPRIAPPPSTGLTGDGLPRGSRAPDFVLPDLAGQPHSLASIRASGKPVLLVFSSPHCESCQALAPKLPTLAARYVDACRIVLVSRGTLQQNIEKVKEPGALLVLLQQNYEVAEAYNCTTSPAAVVVDAAGLIHSPLAVGALAIAQLADSQSSSTPA